MLHWKSTDLSAVWNKLDSCKYYAGRGFRYYCVLQPKKRTEQYTFVPVELITVKLIEYDENCQAHRWKFWIHCPGTQVIFVDNDSVNRWPFWRHLPGTQVKCLERVTRNKADFWETVIRHTGESFDKIDLQLSWQFRKEWPGTKVQFLLTLARDTSGWRFYADWPDSYASEFIMVTVTRHTGKRFYLLWQWTGT
jgi:hypothetical protein